jgi:pimeloyl-ACP methyl ester carboxylesterase
MTLPLVLERTHTKPVMKRPQEPGGPLPYRVEEVVFQNIDAGIRLAGTLTFPPSEGTFPAVLLLSGSGPQDRNELVFGHRPFLVLADYLTRRGIAVLRVDDRGVGGSTGKFDDATAVDYASDAIAGVTYLKSRKEIDHELIGLVGHSEGGMIAPMVAVQSPDIAFLVLIASPGLAIKEMEFSEQARTLKAKGAGDDLIMRNRALQESLFAVIDQEADGNVVQDEFTSIITEYFKGLSEQDRKVTEISEKSLESYIQDKFKRLHSPWFRYYLPYDPGTVLQKVTCPVLAVNGEKDVQVTPNENLREIMRALKAGGNKNYTVKELPGLNHLLQTAETGNISEYGKIEETMSPAALKMIGDWILEQTRICP